jgi:hypothetical protein
MAEANIQKGGENFNSYLNDLGIKISELEEKERLLKDRLLLVGNNLISTKEDNQKQFLEFKKQFKDFEIELKELKQLNQRILSEMGNFARKNELEIVKRQMKMFEPLEYVRLSDLDNILKEGLKKT